MQTLTARVRVCFGDGAARERLGAVGAATGGSNVTHRLSFLHTAAPALGVASPPRSHTRPRDGDRVTGPPSPGLRLGRAGLLPGSQSQTAPVAAAGRASLLPRESARRAGLPSTVGPGLGVHPDLRVSPRARRTTRMASNSSPTRRSATSLRRAQGPGTASRLRPAARRPPLTTGRVSAPLRPRNSLSHTRVLRGLHASGVTVFRPFQPSEMWKPP